MGILEFYQTLDNVKNHKVLKVINLGKPVTQMDLFHCHEFISVMDMEHTHQTLSVVHGSSSKKEVSIHIGKKFEETVKSEDEYGSGFELQKVVVQDFLINVSQLDQ